MDIRTLWVKHQNLALGLALIIGSCLCIVFITDSLVLLAPIALGIFSIIRFFRGSPLANAFWYARNGNIDAAQRILSTYDPSKLSSLKRTYFYFAQAMIDERLERSSLAVENFKHALYEGFLHRDDQAYAHLQVAKSYYLKGQEAEATDHLRLANRSVESDVMKLQIQEFEGSISVLRSEPEPRFLFSE